MQWSAVADIGPVDLKERILDREYEHARLIGQGNRSDSPRKPACVVDAADGIETVHDTCLNVGPVERLVECGPDGTLAEACGGIDGDADGAHGTTPVATSAAQVTQR